MQLSKMTIPQLLAQFERNEKRHARRLNLISFIALWANQFFLTDANMPLENLYAIWAADAKMLGFKFPTDDEVCDAINDGACDYKRFYQYFQTVLLDGAEWQYTHTTRTPAMHNNKQIAA